MFLFFTKRTTSLHLTTVNNDTAVRHLQILSDLGGALVLLFPVYLLIILCQYELLLVCSSYSI